VRGGGAGFNADVAGLLGMRERAVRIGAELGVRS
jgi:hypothetical protein